MESATPAADSGRIRQVLQPALASLAWAIASALPAPAAAGERLSLEQLVQGASRVALYEVALAPPAPRATTVEVLFDAAAGAADPVAPFGACLPDAASLRRLVTSHAHFTDSVPLWRRALREQRYRAVVFLKPVAGVLTPFCETETLLATHWVLHPGHQAWRQELASLLQARQSSPRGADQLTAAASQQLKAGDLTGAIASLEAATALDPSHGAAGLLITTLHQAGRIEEAYTLGERYWREGPRNPRALFRHGWLLAYIGELERADALFRKLVELDAGGIYEAWGNGELAYLARARGDARGAVAFMARAVAARPDDGISRVGLAHMMVDAGDARAAVPLLEAELAKNPAARGYGGVPAALVLGWAHRELGEDAAADRRLDPLEVPLFTANPADPEHQLARQLAYLTVRGRREEALRLAERMPALPMYGAPEPHDGMLDYLAGEPRYEALRARSWDRIDAERRRLGLAPLRRPALQTPRAPSR